MRTEQEYKNLDTVTGCQQVVRQLKRKQQTYLTKIDELAAQLGAPYPTTDTKE